MQFLKQYLAELDNLTVENLTATNATITNATITKATIDDLIVDSSAHIAQEAWTAASLGTGWVNYPGTYHTASYMVDSMGFVHIRGVIQAGAGITTSNPEVLSLASGYRPPAQVLGVVWISATDANYAGQAGAPSGLPVPPAIVKPVTQIAIKTDGTVQIIDGNITWKSSDVISFDTIAPFDRRGGS